jgi:hypothetical protein
MEMQRQPRRPRRAHLARAIRGKDYIRTQDRIITDNTLPPGPASRRKRIAGILRSAKMKCYSRLWEPPGAI